MFDQSFEQRLYSRLQYIDDPTNIPAVVQQVGGALSELSVIVGRVADIDSAWDELEVSLSPTGEDAEVKAYLHVEYKVWTNDVLVVILTLLKDGFLYLTHRNAFEFEFTIP